MWGFRGPKRAKVGYFSKSAENQLSETLLQNLAQILFFSWKIRNTSETKGEEEKKNASTSA